MPKNKWRNMFKEAMKDNYHRSKCLFIDQVYHSGHRLLHESLYSYFSIMHKLIWQVWQGQVLKTKNQVKIDNYV
jgi:hypothetical protein